MGYGAAAGATLGGEVGPALRGTCRLLDLGDLISCEHRQPGQTQGPGTTKAVSRNAGF